MRLICYPMFGEPGNRLPPAAIRPAPAGRAWMDATPKAAARRCLPLVVANVHGWEVLSPCSLTAVWNGGPGKEAVRVATATLRGPLTPASHFGSGVLTFFLGALFRTEPAVNLWVTGPVNSPKDGIYPLTGLVETDWAPSTFTMNWVFTRAHHPVRFEEGEPFCHLFPVLRDTVEAVEPEFRDLDADPEVAAAYQAWAESRARFVSELEVPGSAAQAQEWQKHYYRGLMPDGTPGSDGHRVKLRLRPFAWKQKSTAPEDA